MKNSSIIIANITWHKCRQKNKIEARVKVPENNKSHKESRILKDHCRKVMLTKKQ